MNASAWPLCVRERLPGRMWMPDPDHSRQLRAPEGIVVHSGASADWVAEAALKNAQGPDKPESYHFAWSREAEQIVQLVSLRRRAWHAGPEGNSWLGIALAGPWTLDPRPDAERLDFRALLQELQVAFAGELRWWCRHSEITRAKKDPGPGVTAAWFEGSGLVWRRGPRGG